MSRRPRARSYVAESSSSSSSGSGDLGNFNERVLVLVFRYMNWDLQTLCQTASVSKRLRALAKRLLWRELCAHRAPRMVAMLSEGVSSTWLGDGWQALAKLLLYCCGCRSTRNFELTRPTPGHLQKTNRFSKTSGRSFLAKQCRDDLLFVCDPCEHPIEDKEDDLGVYRGVFRGFMRSKTRAVLIGRQVQLEERVRCPYCGARVWSMTNARLVPKSAARRLGSRDGMLEYFVCVNGHLHGSCWLVPLSSDEDEEDDDDGDGDDDDDDDDGGDDDLGTASQGADPGVGMSSREVVWDGPTG